MKKDFDFKEIGKNTPYTTPEHFFDAMQKKITDSVKKEKDNKRKLKIAVMTILAMAAISVGLIFIPVKRDMQSNPAMQLAKSNVPERVVTMKRNADTSAVKTIKTESHRTVDKREELQKPSKLTNTASVRTADKSSDNDEWIEQLSDDDLSSLTALADNDEFLN